MPTREDPLLPTVNAFTSSGPEDFRKQQLAFYQSRNFPNQQLMLKNLDNLGETNMSPKGTNKLVNYADLLDHSRTDVNATIRSDVLRNQTVDQQMQTAFRPENAQQRNNLLTQADTKSLMMLDNRLREVLGGGINMNTGQRLQTAYGVNKNNMAQVQQFAEQLRNTIIQRLNKSDPTPANMEMFKNYISDPRMSFFQKKQLANSLPQSFISATLR